MTSLAEVTALVEAHVNRDHERFCATALAIAANLAPRSERGAQHLRRLVERAQVHTFMPLPSANGLLSSRTELATLGDMTLAVGTRTRLDRVVLEHTQRDALCEHGLRPARKLLFVGPPGTGKTMAAGALARTFGLPLFRVELHEVISSHLGETAGKLAKVFDHVRTMPAVYLFDEFDALGSERSSIGGESAGAEMRRVVNSLLQFVEDDKSASVIVAATNHAQMLDGAMFRRFDETIVFATPSRSEIVELVRVALGAVDLDFDSIHGEVEGSKLGHADVCAALERVRKDYLLAKSPIDTTAFVAALARRACALRGEVA